MVSAQTQGLCGAVRSPANAAAPSLALDGSERRPSRAVGGASDMTTTPMVRGEPTAASVWQAVAGTSISDELLEWPPDLFALTEVILERSQAYRFVLSPPPGAKWPPTHTPSWADAVVDAGRRWGAWVEDKNGPVPELLSREWEVFREAVDVALTQVDEGRDWRLCQALFTLHAIADEACAGLGAALDAFDGDGSLYRARGRELLGRTGSLARIPSQLMRVLPKVRTPPNGTSSLPGRTASGTDR